MGLNTQDFIRENASVSDNGTGAETGWENTRRSLVMSLLNECTNELSAVWKGKETRSIWVQNCLEIWVIASQMENNLFLMVIPVKHRLTIYAKSSNRLMPLMVRNKRRYQNPFVVMRIWWGIIYQNDGMFIWNHCWFFFYPPQKRIYITLFPLIAPLKIYSHL